MKQSCQYSLLKWHNSLTWRKLATLIFLSKFRSYTSFRFPLLKLKLNLHKHGIRFLLLFSRQCHGLQKLPKAEDTLWSKHFRHSGAKSCQRQAGKGARSSPKPNQNCLESPLACLPSLGVFQGLGEYTWQAADSVRCRFCGKARLSLGAGSWK